MKIIAISGAYRCGMTYLAEKLALTLPNAKHVAFADTLKTLSALKYPDKINEIYAASKTPKTRKLLLDYSKELKSKYGQNFFVRKAFDNLPNNLSYLIISDCRFKIEIEYIAQRNHLFLYLGEVISDYAFDYLLNNHKVCYAPAKPSLDLIHNIILKS